MQLTLLGHRGASHALPENTLAAFAHALDIERADGIECDVRVSSDQVPFLVHDPLLPPEQGGGAIGRIPADQLALPRLTELVTFLAERPRTIVNIELKPVPDALRQIAACEPAFEAIAERHDLIVSSFDPRVMALLPEQYKRAFIFEDPKAVSVLPLLRPGTDLHPAAQLLTATTLAAWSAPDRTFRAWTVDNADEARRLIVLGITAFITNRPGPLRAELEGS